jgi:hypothetical protein
MSAEIRRPVCICGYCFPSPPGDLCGGYEIVKPPKKRKTKKKHKSVKKKK